MVTYSVTIETDKIELGGGLTPTYDSAQLQSPLRPNQIDFIMDFRVLLLQNINAKKISGQGQRSDQPCDLALHSDVLLK